MKKMMAVIAIACLSLLILPSVALADQDNLRVIPAGGGEGALYGTFAGALEAVEDGGTIQLNADITLGDGVEAETTTVALAVGTEAAPVTLDLNGYTLTGTGADSVITIASDAYIILADSSTAGTGTITQPQPAEGVDPTGPAKGGGVYNEGTFTMTGGAISGCGTEGDETYGGGVYNSGTFAMTGGTIDGCVAQRGGGVCNEGENACFSMSGESAIIGCRAGSSSESLARGGGVYLDGESFTMEGKATISACKAIVTSDGDSSDEAYGGGVFINDFDWDKYYSNRFEMKDDQSGSAPQITGCSVIAPEGDRYSPYAVVHGYASRYGMGAGVYVGYLGEFTMEAGSIADCFITESENAEGGGVYVNGNGYFTMNGGSISGCSLEPADSTEDGGYAHGGGVYNLGRFYLYGGSISGCSVTGAPDFSNGGGVYNDGFNGLDVKGDPNVSGNTKNDAPNNVYLAEDSSGNTRLWLIDDFTGSIGISQNAPAVGKQFGSLNSGSAGVENFLCDSAKYYGAVGAVGTLVWAETPVAQIESEGEATTYTTVAAAAEAAQAGDTITMIDDSVETAVVAVSTGSSAKPVTLDLAGHTLTGIGKSKNLGNPLAPVIQVSMSSALTIEDSSADKTGTITQPAGSDTLALGVYVGNGATLTMNGGTITGCNALKGNEGETCGGGVYVYNSTFNMNGGAISACSAVNGGGVYVDDPYAGTTAKFNMSGGEISACTATNGGGVYVKNSTFTMTAGKISDCHALLPEESSLTAANGGGVYGDENSSVNMEGGEISSCDATTNGGGVYSAGTLNVSGSATVTGNTVNSAANNVYLASDPDGAKLNLAGDFTGGIGITQDDATFGVQFGVREAYETYEGVQNFTCDTNAALAAGFGEDDEAGQTALIWKGAITEGMVSLQAGTFTYSGAAQEPSVTVTGAGGALVAGSDYTVDYANNVNAGTATVTVTGAGNYAGTAVKTFEIATQALASANVTLSETSFPYDGEAHMPGTVTVKDSASNVLTLGLDYEVLMPRDPSNPGSAPVNVGTYTVRVVGKGSHVGGGNYSGTVEVTYAIARAGLGSVTLSKTSYTYDGAAKKPTATVKNAAGAKLVAGTDYSVAIYDSAGVKVTSPKAAGKYTVKATGAGNYKGTASKTFTIAKQTLKSANLTLSATTLAWTGKTAKPTITVKNAAGTNLGTSSRTIAIYNSAGKKVSSPTAVGKYTVKATGKGNYAGTVSKAYTVKPAKPSIASLAAGAGSFTVKAGKKPSGYGAVGIEVSYKVKGSSTWKPIKTTSQSKKVTGLKAGKTYSVKVRAYKKVGTSTYYSTWSAAKSVKVK